MIWIATQLPTTGKQRNERDIALLRELTTEASENLQILNECRQLLQADLEMVGKGETITQPLRIVRIGAWDLVRMNPPLKLQRHGQLLLQLQRAAQDSSEINETIRSREYYRTFNRAVTNFGSQMKPYDQVLLRKSDDLLRLTVVLKQQLEALQPDPPINDFGMGP